MAVIQPILVFEKVRLEERLAERGVSLCRAGAVAIARGYCAEAGSAECDAGRDWHTEATNAAGHIVAAVT